MIDENVRKLIREVLAEELRRVKADIGTPGLPRVETVSIATEAELDAFVARLISIGADPKARREVERGELVFRLAGGTGKTGPGSGAASAALSPESAAAGMERGVLSEKGVDVLPKGTRVLRLGRAVKITPLARDRLRQRGIKIERTG